MCKENDDGETLVVVEWVDPETSYGWRDKESVEAITESELPLCETVGWLLRCDDEMVVVASSKNGRGGYGEITKIPQGVVKEIVSIERSVICQTPDERGS